MVEKHRHLLFYALRYEGMEQSPNIVYGGAVPNQLALPAVHWALENLGKAGIRGRAPSACTWQVRTMRFHAY